jgi:hypothetical protein
VPSKRANTFSVATGNRGHDTRCDAEFICHLRHPVWAVVADCVTAATLVPVVVAARTSANVDDIAAMGNSSSSGRGHHDDSVDFGALIPQGIYTGPRDWNQQVVAQAIVDRKLAPFYRPLEDYEEDWDDETILAHRKEPVSEESTDGGSSRPESTYSTSSKHHKRAGSSKQQEQNRLSEAALYRGATECPICFLVRARYRRLCSLSVATIAADSSISVLPAQHKLFTLLRAGPVYRVLRSDQACRANRDPFRVRARRVSVLRASRLRRRIYAASLADGNR